MPGPQSDRSLCNKHGCTPISWSARHYWNFVPLDMMISAINRVAPLAIRVLIMSWKTETWFALLYFQYKWNIKRQYSRNVLLQFTSLPLEGWHQRQNRFGSCPLSLSLLQLLLRPQSLLVAQIPDEKSNSTIPTSVIKIVLILEMFFFYMMVTER